MNPSLEIPDSLTGSDLPAVLLGYQQELMRATASCPVVLCEKSRRIGMTWGVGADAVLTAAASKAAKGMDVFYIGFNLDMTREFIDTCAGWAKAFSYAAQDVEEYIFVDDDGNGNTNKIQAFRIRFDSGFEICALTSRPRSLRGRQGYIIIDEAAFHDDLPELMKAALAMLIWGGKVLVISTHDGVDNAFNQYIQEARAGRNKYKVLRVDFDEALADGLYKRICLVTGKDWSQAAEDAWRQEIVDFYGDGADEELFCIPRLSSGAYLPSLLVERRMQDRPVLRLECPAEFVFLPDYERERFVQDWCSDNLMIHLAALDPKCMSYLGEDFGRSGDLSILWPIQILQNMTRDTPFTVELRNVPFEQQKQIAWYILDRLPRFCGAAFDARGNGQHLAEVTMQRYGAGRIHMVMISQQWYLDAMPKYKAALEDDLFIIPRDADTLNDHRAAQVVRGIPQIPDKRGKGQDGGKRHGDALVAAAMAHWASQQDTVEYDYDTPFAGRGSGPAGTDDDIRRSKAFGNMKGSW